MSFHRWLQDLRSGLASCRSRRNRAAKYRPSLEVLEDRLTPSFSPITSYAVGTNPQAVVTADFNNDGRLDLATANFGSSTVPGTVSVRLGDGQGGFGAAKHFDTGIRPRSMAVGYFDDDAHLDIATVRGSSSGQGSALSHMSVLFGNGDGTFRPYVATQIWGESLAVAAGNFDTDSSNDLVYTQWNMDYGAVNVLLSDGQGGFAESDFEELSGADYYSMYPVGLAVASLNDDGRLDVVTANQYDHTVSVLLGNGDGTLSYDWRYGDDGISSSNFATGPFPRAVAVGDFTGDGIPDVVTAGQTVDVLPGLGDGTFDAPISRSASTSGMTTVAAADLDGDGKLDVVTADPAAGTVRVFLGNGDGTLSPPIDLATGLSPTAVVIGDFNGDGRPDVAAADSDMNAVSVLLNDGVWNALPPPPPPPAPSISITDVTLAEGRKGQKTLFTFTVTLSAPYDQPVTISYRTVNGTATTGNNDYVARSGTITFAPGETTKTITIEVKGDNKWEADEVFYLDLYDESGTLLFEKSRGVGTIVNDD
jgi:hypothetical protein